MKEIILKWLGIEYIVCQEQFLYEIKALKREIDDLDIKGRYHGLLYGEGNLVGMIEIQQRLDKIEEVIE